MANLFISFPGISNYMDCIYCMKDQKSEHVRFVQDAILNILCKDWGKEDRIIFFTTKDAYNKNWLDNGHGNIPVTGLENRIKSLGLPCVTENVMIPEARTEEEIWDIFQIIIDKINLKDEIYLDITHAFRSIPMLAIVILNYATIVKSAEIKGIYYGAFEILGSPAEAKQKPVNERIVPVFDLTAFESLLEWSFAVARFVNSGDASLINKLSQKAVKPVLKYSKGGDIEASAFRNLGNKMENFTDGLATCRGTEVTFLARTLKDSVEECKGFDLIKPFGPLMNIIERELGPFCDDVVKDGISAAEWCLKHNLIQQGYTILQETLITFFAKRMDIVPDCRNNRRLISNGIGVISSDTPFEKWEPFLRKNTDGVEKLRAVCKANADLLKIYQKITPKRNDLNHAGYTKEKVQPQRFATELDDLIKTTIKNI